MRYRALSAFSISGCRFPPPRGPCRPCGPCATRPEAPVISERQGVEPVDDGAGPQHSARTRPVVHLGNHGRHQSRPDNRGHRGRRIRPCRPGGNRLARCAQSWGNPTHPPKRAPAAAARTTSPPGHPQVPPTATWWIGVLRLSRTAGFRVLSAGRPGRRSGRRRRAPWPEPPGRGRRPARRRPRRSRC